MSIKLVQYELMTETHKEELVSLARGLVGKPYRYGAVPEEAPNVFDCSSFTQYLFKQIGIELPRSSILQAADQTGTELPSPVTEAALEPGDLIFMRSDRGHYRDELFSGRQMDIGHVAVYLGNGEVVHARSAAGGVTIQKLAHLISEPHYAIVLAKRF